MIGRRAFLAAAAALPLAVACAPASGTALQRAQRDGVLRVGLSGERPFGYADTDGKVTGAQPEVARAALARMGVGGIEAVQVAFADLLPGLLASRFDLVTAGMTITPDRCAQVAFSRPDFVAPPAFLVEEGNPRGLRSFDDVRRAAVPLAVLSASAELGYARAAGIPDDRLVVVETQRDLLAAVVARTATAGVLTAISLVDALHRNPGTGLEVTGPVVAQARGKRLVPAGGFAMRTADIDLRTRFDAELDTLHASGEWLQITAPFGFTRDNVPPSTLTTESLCST